MSNSSKLSIREVKGKGNGLFADENQSFSIGEKILHESPLFLVQRIQSKRLFSKSSSPLVCNYCLGFIGSLANQFSNLLLLENNENFIFEKMPLENQKLPDPISCIDCKKSFYCGFSCLEKDKTNWHKHVCQLSLPNEIFEKQIQFENICDDNDLENLILAQKIFISCLSSKELENQIEKKFCSEKWTEISSDIGLASKFAKQSWSLIEPLFRHIAKLNSFDEKIITFDYFDKILGLIQMNITETKVLHPLHSYFENLHASISSDLDPEILSQILKLVPLVNEVNAKFKTFPPSVGIALFPTHHFLNHSCDPNAEMGSKNFKLNTNESCAIVSALKQIDANEEITISYVNTNQTFKERQKNLFETFRFHCNCKKCQKEESEN